MEKEAHDDGTVFYKAKVLQAFKTNLNASGSLASLYKK